MHMHSTAITEDTFFFFFRQEGGQRFSQDSITQPWEEDIARFVYRYTGGRERDKMQNINRSCLPVRVDNGVKANRDAVNAASERDPKLLHMHEGTAIERHNSGTKPNSLCTLKTEILRRRLVHGQEWNNEHAMSLESPSGVGFAKPWRVTKIAAAILVGGHESGKPFERMPWR